MEQVEKTWEEKLLSMGMEDVMLILPPLGGLEMAIIKKAELKGFRSYELLEKIICDTAHAWQLRSELSVRMNRGDYDILLEREKKTNHSPAKCRSGVDVHSEEVTPEERRTMLCSDWDFQTRLPSRVNKRFLMGYLDMPWDELEEHDQRHLRAIRDAYNRWYLNRRVLSKTSEINHAR